MKPLTTLLKAAALTLAATSAEAALFDQPVAANAYITVNGLDWA